MLEASTAPSNFIRSKDNKALLELNEALPLGSDLDRFYVRHGHVLALEEKVLPPGQTTVDLTYAQWLMLSWLDSVGAAAFLVVWAHSGLCDACGCVRPDASAAV